MTTLKKTVYFTGFMASGKSRIGRAIAERLHATFIDTDALVTRFFMDFLDGENPKTEANRVLADAIDGLNSYDLILFLEPDVEFFLEGGRSEEIRDNREYYSNRIKELLRSHGRGFVCIGGDYKERYEKAVAAVQELLSGKCDE